MTTAKTIERTLRKTGIFPPSVQDSHYGDKAEMSREEIIEKTLGEMSLFSSLEQGSQSSNKADHLSTVILELQRRLPVLSNISMPAAAIPATRPVPIRT
jgi:hypothetical protein